MQHSTAPASIGTNNPFYCPAFPASAYLKHIRKSLLPETTVGRNSGGLFSQFARMLDECGIAYDSDSGSVADFVYNPEHDWIVGVNVGQRRKPAPRAVKPRSLSEPADDSDQQSSLESPCPKSVAGAQGCSDPITGRNAFSYGSDDDFTLPADPPKLQSTAIHEQQANINKRKRSGSESGASDSSLGRPLAKYAKSDLSAANSSFEILVFREKVNFDVPGSEPITAEFGSNDVTLTGDEMPTLGTLLKAVAMLLPGMRIEERLANIPELDVQKMADFLTYNGYMNHSVLKVFRKTDVASLALGISLHDEDGLNICGRDVMECLGTPYSFLNLTELSFSESRVEDFTLRHLHHLPKLSVLYLNNTGIGNEAVYLLVPLKLTLKRLSLATNPDITSESAPALLLLANLEFLSMCDTGIDMVGLRLFAKTILEEQRTIDIEIPYSCEEYIDNLHSKYLVEIEPPLVSSPEECGSLTVAALKKNLAAHAEVNPAIVATGTKGEMVPRLREILVRRQMDLVVARMLLGA